MASIVIAEDERDIRDLIKFTLTYAGHEIADAPDGKKAVELAAEVMPDLILLDLRMPKLNGFEACEAIKKDERTKDIPVVFLSARGIEEERDRANEAGAMGFIMKPFSPDDLSRRVGELLESIEAAKS